MNFPSLYTARKKYRRYIYTTSMDESGATTRHRSLLSLRLFGGLEAFLSLEIDEVTCDAIFHFVCFSSLMEDVISRDSETSTLEIFDGIRDED